uniref:Prephenate dehydratase domain-containing protein n=1 Tax=Lactuca sativa TaxID=4236 RepID=A0A9R1UYX9_LACSA|nr:hypothetical protein LSAT_V11C700346980 [Lactuca sativa]
MSKNGIGPNAKNQNGEANGSPVSAVTSPDFVNASESIRDTGAVASSRAAEIGLDILAQIIQDDLDNITRFLILAREPIIPGIDKPHKTSLVFTLEEGPRVLFNALAVFSLRNV